MRSKRRWRDWILPWRTRRFSFLRLLTVELSLDLFQFFPAPIKPRDFFASGLELRVDRLPILVTCAVESWLSESGFKLADIGFRRQILASISSNSWRSL